MTETIWHGSFIANLPTETDPNIQVTTRVEAIGPPDEDGNAYHSIAVTVTVGAKPE